MKKIMGQIIENQYLSVSRTQPHLFLLFIFLFSSYCSMLYVCILSIFNNQKKIFHKSLFFSFFSFSMLYFPLFLCSVCFFFFFFLFFFIFLHNNTHPIAIFLHSSVCIYIQCRKPWAAFFITHKIFFVSFFLSKRRKIFLQIRFFFLFLASIISHPHRHAHMKKISQLYICVHIDTRTIYTKRRIFFFIYQKKIYFSSTHKCVNANE